MSIPEDSIPKAYIRMKDEQPALMEAYESFGRACAEAGPLDGRCVALAKLSISLGAGMEGGARSHARKALEAGCSREDLLHVAHLCAPTIGFPAMMRARSVILGVLGGDERSK